jgi:hypothetical protein
MGTARTFMSRFLALLILYMFTGTITRASVSAAFEQANRLYEQGRFSEVAAAYAALTSTSQVPVAVWFNLGNAAYKSGEVGRAIVAYRMAERRTPRDPSLRANLQFVRSKVYSDERTRVPFWKSAVRFATLNEWTILATVLLWAGFSVLACGEVTGRRYTKSAGLILLLAGVSGTMSLASWRDHQTPEAIVVAREAVVRFGPLNESQAAFQLRDGAEAVVVDQKNGWLQVRDAEKRVGWVRRDEVIVLPSR